MNPNQAHEADEHVRSTFPEVPTGFVALLDLIREQRALADEEEAAIDYDPVGFEAACVAARRRRVAELELYLEARIGWASNLIGAPGRGGWSQP